MKRFLSVLALALTAMAIVAGTASAYGFYQPAVKVHNNRVAAQPRLVTVKQPASVGAYTVRYSIEGWEHYGHLAAVASARAFALGRSFPVQLGFHRPRNVRLNDGAHRWVFTRLTVDNYTRAYPDTGYDYWFIDHGLALRWQG